MQLEKDDNVVYFFSAIGGGTHRKPSVSELAISWICGGGQCQCGGENMEDRAQSQVLSPLFCCSFDTVSHYVLGFAS